MDAKYIEVQGLNAINKKAGEGYEVVQASYDQRGHWLAIMAPDEVAPLLRSTLEAVLPDAILQAFKLQKTRQEQAAQVQTEMVDPALVSKGVGIIALERLRQIEEEGFSLEHDDDDGELAMAAACYASEPRRGLREQELQRGIPAAWPWDALWWRPSPTGDRVRDLAKAGALIAAEIDRLLRQAAYDLAEAQRIRNDPDEEYVDAETAFKELDL